MAEPPVRGDLLGLLLRVRDGLGSGAILVVLGLEYPCAVTGARVLAASLRGEQTSSRFRSSSWPPTVPCRGRESGVLDDERQRASQWL
jgi:hypothetical protein